MKRCAQFVLGLLATVVIVPSLAGEPVTIEVLKERAVKDAATQEGRAYLKEFNTNPFMLALDAADEQCRDAQSRSGTPEEWVMALSIGANGYPTDALVTPDNEGLQCIAERLKATAFIKPPHDGFAIYMPAKLTEPGTERRPAVAAPEDAPKR